MARPDTDEIERTRLEAMNAAICHRGPDSDGFFYGPGIGLGIRRLAIIDLVTGDQPIANEDQTLWIVFNGEIYNFPELRARLEKLGHKFHTETDTESILHLYEEYGDECIQHLRGMFAFALWDAKAQRLLIARDRLGQKPIYYSQQNGTLCFSSELPSLLKGLGSSPSIHLEAIDLYLSMQYIPDPLTPFEGIYKLPAAHRLVWQRDPSDRQVKTRVERYWQIDYEPKWTESEEQLTADLRQRLEEAVRIRLISDVPLGAHLSGGIDSSIVVALMAQASSQPVKTFSVGFEEESFSELSYARSIATRYHTDHHEFILAYGDIPSTLERLVVHMGEPLADPSALPLYHLSRLTRRHVTVALNGDGGDEAFAGYQRYWWDPWANRYTRLPGILTRRLIPGLVDRLPDNFEQPVGGSLLQGLKRMDQLARIDPRSSILRWGSYFSPYSKEDLWRSSYRPVSNSCSAERFLIDQFEAAPASSFLDRTLFTDVNTYLPGDLLVKADRMAMANSLEGRSPFLDHELMSWAARLPESMKVRGLSGKYLLRKAYAAELPPSIQKRGKQGFGIPLSAWFRGPLTYWTRDILLDTNAHLGMWFNRPAMERLINQHLEGRIDHGKRLWALVVLGLWAEGVANH